ncbi:MAG: DUF4421 domain-containing protein [Flavobacteriaceae bacterium]|nr:DUF4421 domain-containing protein [Flavobacteriaceae bacterium]
MNLKCSIFIFLIPVFIFSQENLILEDSIPNNSKFIEDYSNQLNIKFDVTNDRVSYFIPFETSQAEIRSNLNISYGLVFSYKFLSVRLGMRPKLSENELKNKGKTDRFRLRVKFLFDNWTHRLEYNYTRGFYIENTSEFENDIKNSNFKVQFPYLRTNILSGSSNYKFNGNYSMKALESNTEIQLKSTGTFLAGFNYAFYFVNGTDRIKLENQELLQRTSYNDFSGFSPVFYIGYHYTFVFHNYWYLNVYLDPGIGFDFYQNKFNNQGESYDNLNTNVFFQVKSGFSAGYNGRKIYFGGTFKYNYNSDKVENNTLGLQPIKNSFHLFFGYRFKAPKQVTKPIKYIEEKVPVLKQNNI